MKYIFRGISLAVVLVLTLFAGSSFGDDVYGRIRGQVTDPTGAAVAGAQLTATNVATGISKTVTTGAGGNFEFVQLPVGTYNVTASGPNFKEFHANGIPLTVNQTYQLAIQLSLGSIREQVEVQADQVQVDTSSTQLTTLVSEKQIVDMPLIGRNWTQLEQLAPGVVASSDRFGTYSANGSQSNQSSYLINGVDDNDLPLNTPSIVPSPDALTEFNLITNSINAEYGRNSGAIVNALIKNGTNSWHGNAFEFYRDTFLNTHNFFQKTAPVFHQNLFGGTIGGPIWKDHTFFFLSYQGLYNRAPQTSGGLTTVFTQDQRNGIFSDIASSTNVSPVPLVGDDGATHPAGTPYSTLFSQGFIPQADFNPISTALIQQYVPLPNFNGTKYSFNPSQTNSQKQGIARIDQTFSDKDTVWGTAFFQNQPTQETLPFTGATLPGFGDQSQRSYKQFIVDWGHTFNATTLNEFRLGYTRFNFVTVFPIQPVQPSSAGFNINPQLTSGAGLPFIGVTGFFNLGFSTNGPQPRIDQTYELTDNFSKIVGKHSFKMGFDGRRFDVWNPFSGRNNGSFSFGHKGTFSTGDSGADFLLGFPDSFSQGSGGLIIARAYEGYAYFQDSWKATQNLTINYGTGYQVDTPYHNNQFGGVDVNCFRPGQQSTVYPTAPQDLLFPGDKGCDNTGGLKTHWDHFGPRLGFVWAPHLGWLSGSGTASKFTINAGWGLYFNRTEEEGALQNLGALPYGQNLSVSNPTFANPWVTQAGASPYGGNPFPYVLPTPGSPVDWASLEPFSFNVFDSNFTTPYAENYHLTIERELPSAAVLSIGYVGSVGRHLYRSFDGNPVNAANWAACQNNTLGDPALEATTPCSTDVVSNRIDYPSLTLYPGNIYAGLGVQGTNGSSNYNALEISLKKQPTHGLGLQLSYTWSHALDNGSGLEDTGFNGRGITILPQFAYLNYGDSAYDARQRLVLGYTYEIPNLHNVMNRAPSLLFKGWEISGITTLQTGFPVTISDSGFTSDTCSAGFFYYNCGDTPNTTSFNIQTLNPRTSTGNLWFNPAPFSAAPAGTFGNVRRNFFHGPGLNNTDLAIMKNTYIGNSETRYVQLRLEAYNLFNHTQFCAVVSTNCASGIDGDIQDLGSTFGQVFSAQPGRLVQLGVKVYF